MEDIFESVERAEFIKTASPFTASFLGRCAEQGLSPQEAEAALEKAASVDPLAKKEFEKAGVGLTDSTALRERRSKSPTARTGTHATPKGNITSALLATLMGTGSAAAGLYGVHELNKSVAPKPEFAPPQPVVQAPPPAPFNPFPVQRKWAQCLEGVEKKASAENAYVGGFIKRCRELGMDAEQLKQTMTSAILNNDEAAEAFAKFAGWGSTIGGTLGSIGGSVGAAAAAGLATKNPLLMGAAGSAGGTAGEALGSRAGGWIGRNIFGEKDEEEGSSLPGAVAGGVAGAGIGAGYGRLRNAGEAIETPLTPEPELAAPFPTEPRPTVSSPEPQQPVVQQPTSAALPKPGKRSPSEISTDSAFGRIQRREAPMRATRPVMPTVKTPPKTLTIPLKTAGWLPFFMKYANPQPAAAPQGTPKPLPGPQPETPHAIPSTSGVQTQLMTQPHGVPPQPLTPPPAVQPPAPLPGAPAPAMAPPASPQQGMTHMASAMEKDAISFSGAGKAVGQGFGAMGRGLGQAWKGMGSMFKGAPKATPTPLSPKVQAAVETHAPHWADDSYRGAAAQKIMQEHGADAGPIIKELSGTLPKETWMQATGKELRNQAPMIGAMTLAPPLMDAGSNAIFGHSDPQAKARAAQQVGMHLAQAASLNDQEAFQQTINSKGMNPQVSQALQLMWQDENMRGSLANQDTAANTVYQLHQHLQTNPNLTGQQLAEVMRHQKAGADQLYWLKYALTGLKPTEFKPSDSPTGGLPEHQGLGDLVGRPSPTVQAVSSTTQPPAKPVQQPAVAGPSAQPQAKPAQSWLSNLFARPSDWLANTPMMKTPVLGAVFGPLVDAGMGAPPDFTRFFGGGAVGQQTKQAALDDVPEASLRQQKDLRSLREQAALQNVARGTFNPNIPIEQVGQLHELPETSPHRVTSEAARRVIGSGVHINETSTTPGPEPVQVSPFGGTGHSKNHPRDAGPVIQETRVPWPPPENHIPTRQGFPGRGSPPPKLTPRSRWPVYAGGAALGLGALGAGYLGYRALVNRNQNKEASFWLKRAIEAQRSENSMDPAKHTSILDVFAGNTKPQDGPLKMTDTATPARIANTPQTISAPLSQRGQPIPMNQEKQGVLTGGLIGAGLGSMSAPEGHRSEGAGRGLIRGGLTELGATLPGLAMLEHLPRNKWGLLASIAAGLGGGAVGYLGAGRLMGAPTWKPKDPINKQAADEQTESPYTLGNLGSSASATLGGLIGGSATGNLGSHYIQAQGGAKNFMTSGPKLQEADLPALAEAAGVDHSKIHRVTGNNAGWLSGPAASSPEWAKQVRNAVRQQAMNPTTEHIPDSARHVIMTPKGVSRAVMAHELGHAGTHEMLGNWHHPAVAASGALASLGSFGGTLGGALGSRNAALIGTAMALPQLLSEFGASHVGGYASAKTLQDRSLAGRAKAYLGAYKGTPTYAARAAMPLGAYGTRRLIDHLRGHDADYQQKKGYALPFVR